MCFMELCRIRRMFNPAPSLFSRADESCEDRQLLLTMFKEIESETGARLYDKAEEAGGGAPGVEVLPPLLFPPGKSGVKHRGNNKTTASSFPKALQNLLEDPSIAKVGVNINSDATYLEQDYGVEVANTVDLRTCARQSWVETPCRSLAGMTSHLLGRQLPKDPVVRLSRWSAPLADKQVQYACLDAYASVLVYQEVAKFQDPILFPPPVELQPGTKVEQALVGKGMTPEAVVEYKDKNWTFFVRNCRRLVPEEKRLLERFNATVVDALGLDAPRR
ncbi:unnamed protein product [Ectocarpus sp. CCAP 1310/34]|nr:unnamed protein product [Ectocarpus sp. CCAP 1310/34]